MKLLIFVEIINMNDFKRLANHATIIIQNFGLLL
jgi:hypothetical protein